jgi:SPP1 gp7 family putative phage head morphogenesis protein
MRGVAKEVMRLIKGYEPNDILSAEKLKRALYAYSEIIDPWARYIVRKVLADIADQDIRAWNENSKRMSVALRKEIAETPLGEAYKELMAKNVALIKSIPIDAAIRVHGLVTENLMQSARADEIAKKILETEAISLNRATLIARTEVSRASSVLTQTRAQRIGSTSYIWHTSKDLLVRKSHKEMDGREFKWSEPPTLSDGTKTHPGCIYNCRCYPEPVIPGELLDLK